MYSQEMPFESYSVRRQSQIMWDTFKTEWSTLSKIEIFNKAKKMSTRLVFLNKLKEEDKELFTDLFLLEYTKINKTQNNG